jgi:hypothetical protein
MITKKDLVKIELAKILDRNGNPFTLEQAESFLHDGWYHNIRNHYDMIKTLVESNGNFNPKSEVWIKELSYLHSQYRVQNFVLHIKKGKYLPPVEIRYGHEGIKGYVLIDGRHRCWAYHICGEKYVPAYLEKWQMDKETEYSAII